MVAAHHHLPCNVVSFSTLKNVNDFATNLISLRPVVMTLPAFETNFWTPCLILNCSELWSMLALLIY